MSHIKIPDVRALSDNDLKTKIDDLTLELAIETRKIKSTGVSSKVVKVREMRRDIARMKTVIKERGATKR